MGVRIAKCMLFMQYKQLGFSNSDSFKKYLFQRGDCHVFGFLDLLVVIYLKMHSFLMMLASRCFVDPAFWIRTVRLNSA